MLDFKLEVVSRLGRVSRMVYRSAEGLEHALREAAIAHGKQEAEPGHEDRGQSRRTWTW